VKWLAEWSEAELMAALDEIEQELRARRLAAGVADEDQRGFDEFTEEMSLGGRPAKTR
jgi:hypothetical protein